MRRASIIGPLILIVIGALLLINNLRPELSIWSLLAQNWPYLLIIWGLLRIGEITMWATQNKPLPVNGIGGGEWGLIVFLTLLGTSSFYFHTNPFRFARFPVEVFGESYDYPVNASHGTGAAPRIVIYNMRGDTHITSSDLPEVRVTGTKTIRTLDKTRADQADQQTPVEIEAKGDQVFVRANEYRAASNGQVTYDLQLVVPKGATIEGHGRRGDFDISDITGGVEIQSDNAGVRVQNVGGDIKVDTGRSDIVRVVNAKGAVELRGHGDDVELDTIAGQVTIDGRYGGQIELRKLAKPLEIRGDSRELNAVAVPGQIKLTRGNLEGDDIVGPVTVTARSLDVNIGRFTQSLNVNLQRGDLDLRPGRVPLAKIEAHTNTGRVDLALPENAKFELTARTDRGDMENEYGAPLTLEETGKKSATLRGSVGQGPTIQVSTSHGDIAVHRGSTDAREGEKANASGESSDLPKPPKAPKAPKAPQTSEQ